MWDSDPIKGDPLGRARYRVVARGKTVTQCYYSSSDENSEWDARLIAAAPELLAFVQSLIADYMSDDGMDSEKTIVKHAQAIVDKATGVAQ